MRDILIFLIIFILLFPCVYFLVNKICNLFKRGKMK